MKTRTLYLVILLLTQSSFVLSQQADGLIKGSVIDMETDEILEGVNIQIEGSAMGAASDSSGKYVLQNLQAGKYNLIFSIIGYASKQFEAVEVIQGKAIELNVGLSQELMSINEIVVTPGSFSIMGEMPVSRQTLSNADMKNISFAEDITRAVSRLPGVSSNDFSSKFTVRGGEADEVLMVLDGMELYEPFHQRDFAGGLFSIVDIEAISGVDLLTGGFSAEYGDRQSAIFNMRTKNIRNDERHTSLGLSIMNARLYTDGTFANNRGNYLFSARRGMLDQAFKLIDETENTPTFYDMIAKIEYKPNSMHTLSFHGLHAGDETKVRDVSPEAHDIHDTQYYNSYGWFTLKSFFSPAVYTRTLLYGGEISHTRNGDTDKYEPSDKLSFKLKDKRTYNFFGLKQDWNWEASNNFSVKSGFDLKQLNADYDYFFSVTDTRINSSDSLVQFADGVDIKKKPSGQQAKAYVSGRIRALPKLFIEGGLRYDHASYTNDDLISPRLSFAYAFSKNTFLRGAWGHYYQTQFINNLDVNHNTSNFNQAELSKHYVVGLEHLFDSGISIRLDGYYKDISRISNSYQNLRDPWEVFPESRNDVIKLDMDGAKAKGVELFLKYDMGKTISWWFSYSLADAVENIKSIEFAGLLDKQTGELPRINNQLHTVYADLNYRPNQNWHFNLSWQYYEGWPLTIYEYEFQVLPNGDLHFYPNHLTFREKTYPAYHRMDLRINRHFYFDSGKLSTFLHVINVYNRENLKKFDLDVRNDQDEFIPDGDGGFKYPRDDSTWLGLIPAIGISYEF